MINLARTLEKHLRFALEKTFPEIFEDQKQSWTYPNNLLVPASKPEFGDFQVNVALSLAKTIKKTPRQIAMAIVEDLKSNPEFLKICTPPKIAGPGFINIEIRPESLISELKCRLKDERLGVEKISTKNHDKKPSRVLVDFSSPNIAKEMHVGHLRSTIIGDAISRILEFRGHEVIRINHIGDWGTQFGMLITHLKDVAPEALHKVNTVNLGDLVGFYREAKKRFDSDENFQQSAREQVIKLQGGDPDSLKAWKILCNQSRHEFENIYKLLDVRLIERGESFYNQYLDGVIEDLNNSGLLINDQGAECVLLEGILGKDGKPLPMIVKKSDGGYNYATTDLAAIRFRFQEQPNGDGAWRLIYVTDSGQSNHFEGVFEIAKRANWIPTYGRVEHVPFGLVQGEDRKKLKTRSGDTVRLKDLLDEAILRAEKDIRKRLTSESREANEEFIKQVSSTVGIAAVKYADLSQNRITDYQFNFDRMLALQGNTAPYLLYALVRIAGIARKGGDLMTHNHEIYLTEPQEWDLARSILKFDEIIKDVEEELLPNRLCSYLFELSQVFNRFYDQLPVLKATESSKSSRLSLCSLTARTLKLGMNLLGIPTLERM